MTGVSGTMDDWQRVALTIVFVVVAASASSYRPPAPANASTSPTPVGQIGTCAPEVFSIVNLMHKAQM